MFHNNYYLTTTLPERLGKKGILQKHVLQSNRLHSLFAHDNANLFKSIDIIYKVQNMQFVPNTLGYEITVVKLSSNYIHSFQDKMVKF